MQKAEESSPSLPASIDVLISDLSEKEVSAMDDWGGAKDSTAEYAIEQERDLLNQPKNGQ